MIAYNKSWLENLFIQRETGEAFDQGCISKEERDAIYLKYPVSFYTPNFFIRIGLFLLTLVILLFSFGLLSLLFLDQIDKMISGLAVFFSLLCYAILEMMVYKKKHYQSGVDDGLLWVSAATLFFAISLPNNLGALANCMLIFIITLYCALRFADRLMASLFYLSLLGIAFFACLQTGPDAKAFVPFIIMTISAILYFIARKGNAAAIPHVYSDFLTIIEIISLGTFYIAGNYFVVREVSNTMFHMNLQPGQSIPFGWLFWIFSILIPLVYLFRGIQKKDVILIRVGLLLVAALIFTLRYYNSLSPIEMWMVMGGIILVAVAWGLIRYLHVPKHGFTFRETNSKHILDNMRIESLVLAETFSGVPAAEDETKFGGGSFGGGGSSGEF